MTDPVVVALEEDEVTVELQSDPVLIALEEDEVTIALDESVVVCLLEEDDPIVIEVGIPGAQGPPGGVLATFLEAEAGVALTAGQVVYASTAGKWELAKADSITATRAYGLVTTDVNAGFLGTVLNAGQLELTTSEWDDVIEGAGTGGLTPGAIYFLSNSAAGEITTTPVTTGFRVPVGRAITDARMAVQLEECIKL